MGFNPYPKSKHGGKQRSRYDIVFVAAGLVVCIALLVWAFFG